MLWRVVLELKIDYLKVVEWPLKILVESIEWLDYRADVQEYEHMKSMQDMKK